MQPNILIFKTLVAICNVQLMFSQRVIWDNDVEIYYPENDVLAKEGDLRFPNWFFIYPGTKWCGAGNIAENFDDLGPHKATDKCCREHDNCKDSIFARETKYNLTNTSYFTRLHCDCDETFLMCLKSLNTKTSKQVGMIYFTGLGTKCFKKEYPIIECVKFTYFPTVKCIAYDVDYTQEPKYQWFDVPNF